MASMQTLGRQAVSHWKKHRPKMASYLERKGLLQKAAIEAQERATEAILDLLEQGVDLEAAKEIVLPQTIFLPSEEEMPILPPDLMPFNLSPTSIMKSDPALS